MVIEGRLHIEELVVGFPRAETSDPKLIKLRAKWDKIRACNTQQKVWGGE